MCSLILLYYLFLYKYNIGLINKKMLCAAHKFFNNHASKNGYKNWGVHWLHAHEIIFYCLILAFKFILCLRLDLAISLFCCCLALIVHAWLPGISYTEYYASNKIAQVVAQVDSKDSLYPRIKALDLFIK